METIKPLRRLPLQGTSNTRDLGGYPCAGGVTRWRAFVRSDRPDSLTAEDLAFLKAYGVANAVDLRGDTECQRRPSRLDEAAGFTLLHVPISDQIHDIDYEGDLPGSMSGLYIELLDNVGADIARVFRFFAGATGGCLFNCTVGKDRTGVVAMLLLSLAGVADADIVADYMMTEVYMRSFIGDHMAEQEIPLYVLRSKPDSMWRALEHLNGTWGGAEKYLLGVGLSADELATIKARLVEPAGL